MTPGLKSYRDTKLSAQSGRALVLLVFFLGCASAGLFAWRLYEINKANKSAEATETQAETNGQGSMPPGQDLGTLLAKQGFTGAEADVEDLADLDEESKPDIPLPPFEDWITGKWHLAVTRGAIVYGPFTEDEELQIQIAATSDNPMVFEARVLACGKQAGKSLGLKPQKGQAILRFKLLPEASERGKSARFRIAKFNPLSSDPKKAWSSRNDYAYVDYLGNTIHGNVGTWLRDKP